MSKPHDNEAQASPLEKE